MKKLTIPLVRYALSLIVVTIVVLLIFSNRAISQRSLNTPQLLTPYEQANLHNSSEATGVDILSTSLTPAVTPSLFRIMVATDTAALFKARITKSTNTQTVIFNSNVDLIANAVYIFDILVHSGDTVNFQFDDNVTVTVFRVQEVKAGAQ